MTSFINSPDIIIKIRFTQTFSLAVCFQLSRNSADEFPLRQIELSLLSIKSPFESGRIFRGNCIKIESMFALQSLLIQLGVQNAFDVSKQKDFRLIEQIFIEKKTNFSLAR